MASRAAWWVNLGAEAVAASTPYVLVDISDTVNFPHSKATHVHLLGLLLNTEKASDGVFDIWVGVVTECDGTDGTAQWVHVFHIEAAGNPTDSTDRFVGSVDFTLAGARPNGVNLALTSEATTFFVGNQTQASNVNWQNDVNRASPVGATTKVGAGDLVVWVEEVSGSGTLDFSLSACYAIG